MSQETAIANILNSQAVLSTSEILSAGVYPRTLYRLRDEGRLIELSRGIFRSAELPPLENSDLITIAKRAPKAIICLISALSFHEITDEIPHEIYVAVPTGTDRPTIDFPPTRTFHFSPESYEAGLERHVLDGIGVNIYSMEKTIADCFKFRNQVGLDVAIQGLRRGLSKRASRKKIVEFAGICRVQNVIRPYMEAMQ
ncbi:MAG TPA: type IV toxin-antitoxin system AbiEi family antitoxin domain-containing protein [Pyrinomonadaceae bacterium]|nr:type IV toxin-antitoxin system AbiEi family antitoxin domain-containing protein [Pyrinomonadaceae bacterium]